MNVLPFSVEAANALRPMLEVRVFLLLIMASNSWETQRNRLEAAFEPATPGEELVVKPMFGGACAYLGGRIFASLSDVGLALKLSPADQIELLEIEGAKRLQYEPDAPVSRQYIVIPPDFAAAALSPWVERSLAFVKSGPAPKSRRKA